MNQQRKIIRYKGTILKIVPSGEGYMQWIALLPNYRRGARLHDPTSTSYSVKDMKRWLNYARDDVTGFLAFESELKAGLGPVSFWAAHRPAAVNSFTGKERLVRKQYNRKKIRLGEYTKYPPQLKPWFKVSWALWAEHMGWAEEAAHRDEIPYLQEEQNGSISSGEDELEP